MAQSAEDVARESIECFNAGDFDRLRSLLADDSYEEELQHSAASKGRCPGRGGTGVEAGVPGWARHGARHVRGRQHGHDRAHLGGHAEWPDADARRSGATAVEPARNGQGVPGHRSRGRQDPVDSPLLRPHDAAAPDRRNGADESSHVAGALSEFVEGRVQRPFTRRGAAEPPCMFRSVRRASNRYGALKHAILRGLCRSHRSTTFRSRNTTGQDVRSRTGTRRATKPLLAPG